MPSVCQLVAIDFAVGGCQRTKLRLHVFGQLYSRKSLLHARPGKVVLDAFLENELHDRQAKDRSGADDRQLGNAPHRQLNGDRDLSLDFFGCPAGIRRDDCHDLRGNVGIGINLLLAKCPNAKRSDAERGAQDHETMPQRKLN